MLTSQFSSSNPSSVSNCNHSQALGIKVWLWVFFSLKVLWSQFGTEKNFLLTQAGALCIKKESVFAWDPPGSANPTLPPVFLHIYTLQFLHAQGINQFRHHYLIFTYQHSIWQKRINVNYVPHVSVTSRAKFTVSMARSSSVSEKHVFLN